MDRDDPVYLEIQIHPPDIRSGVRYLFLSRRQVGWTIAAAVFAVGVTVWTLVATPFVIADAQNRHRFDHLSETRTMQGQRLVQLLDRFELLEARTEGVRLRMEQVHLAYGLTTDESIGQGGFPARPAEVPDSIFGRSIRLGNEASARLGEAMDVIGAFVTEVEAFEHDNLSQADTTPSLSPLARRSFVLTSPFGHRRNPFTKANDFHAGIDMAATVGTEIRAPSDGLVVFAGRYDMKRSVAWWRYGNLVVLRHDDRFISLYGHCDEVLVKRGDAVSQGDLLGTVGNTGWSTNPHLHYEVRRRMDDGEYTPVDPRIYILDHLWLDEERLLVQARSTPTPKDYQPLPGRLVR